MKKQTTLILSSVLALSGCATPAAPNLIGGNYYMVGDSQCKRYREDRTNHDRVYCYDDDMKYTGQTRYPMTAEQLQMYQYQQQAQAQQIQNLNMQLQATNAQLAAQNAQNAQIINSTRYSVPVVAPIQQQGNTVIRCISTGIYTNCRE